MEGNATDPIQGFSPQLWVCFPHCLRWLLVSCMSVTVCYWTCNSTGFLGRRAWQGPEALREIGKALLASSTRLCHQPQASDLSTGQCLPSTTHSAELRQRRCLQPPPRCSITLAILITFCSLDPGHGCCGLSALQVRAICEGEGWDAEGTTARRSHRAPWSFARAPSSVLLEP